LEQEDEQGEKEEQPEQHQQEEKAEKEQHQEEEQEAEGPRTGGRRVQRDRAVHRRDLTRARPPPVGRTTPGPRWPTTRGSSQPRPRLVSGRRSASWTRRWV
jgi:hypothetical protein